MSEHVKPDYLASAAPEAPESETWREWREAQERAGQPESYMARALRAEERIAALESQLADPVDMLLFCPNCAEQHVDEARPGVCETCGKGESECSCGTFTAWLNPPHKSHRCNFCNHVWRPADVPTNGVREIKTKGSRDNDAKPREAIAWEAARSFESQLAEANKKAERAELCKRYCEALGVEDIQAFIKGLRAGYEFQVQTAQSQLAAADTRETRLVVALENTLNAWAGGATVAQAEGVYKEGWAAVAESENAEQPAAASEGGGSERKAA